MAAQTLKKISDGVLALVSSLAQETTSFAWNIEGIDEIRKLDAWEAINRQFKVGKFTWRLSLASDDMNLYVVPTLKEPPNSVVKFTLKTSIINHRNEVVHVPKPGGLGYFGLLGGKPNQMWKLIQFQDTIHNDNLAEVCFNNSFKLFVEMTVFFDTNDHYNL